MIKGLYEDMKSLRGIKKMKITKERFGKGLL